MQQHANSFASALSDREPDLALAALQKGDARAAFALADRWRRTGGPNAASLLTRSEAARRLGMDDFAQADLLAALERDPLNPHCNLKVLETGLPGYGPIAARRLIERSHDETAVALDFLSNCDSVAGVASFRYQTPKKIEGWATWRPGKSAKLVILGGKSQEFAIASDPTDPRARFFGCAAAISFEIADPESDLALFRLDEETIASIRLPWRGGESEAPLPCGPETATLIIPVYDDFEATRDCLESAAKAIQSTDDAQLLIVDDASPHPLLPDYLRQFAERPRTRLVVNRRNRGYVATVNRALSLAQAGDVLLLNADTLVSPDILDRFRSIARLDARIGAINPLSNHGEFVSFPKPFVENTMDRRNWPRIHEVAGEVNPLIVIDAPASSGFCLFLTRACLDAVGPLSDEYENGYLEDADYALRIRETGFRNVCAPSIFVPHVGSLSFRGDKKDLVARNLRVLKRRFPDHESECDAFMLLDPLAPARARIERALLADGPPRRMVMGPACAQSALARRARLLAEQDVDTLIAVWAHDGEHWRLRLRGAANRAPQNLAINLDDATEIADVLSRLSPDGIEITGEQHAPPTLLRALSAHSAALWRLIISAPTRTAALAFSGEIALDSMGQAACGDVIPPRAAPYFPPAAAATPTIGILFPAETPAALSFLLDMTKFMGATDCRFILLGEASIDRSLMGRGLFVTGPVEEDETSRVVDQYDVGRYLLPYRDSHYWALESYRAERPLPAAYFDWSGANFRAFSNDLPLAPTLDDASAILCLKQWLAGDADENPG